MSHIISVIFNFLKKLISILRYILAIFGISMFVWALIGGIHDLKLSSQAFQCTEKTLGPRYIDYLAQNDDWKIKNRWHHSAQNFIDSHEDRAIRQHLIDSLKTNCSDYIGFSWLTSTDGCDEGAMSLKNWALGIQSPAYFSEFMESLILWLAFAVFFTIGPSRLIKTFMAFVRKLKFRN